MAAHFGKLDTRFLDGPVGSPSGGMIPDEARAFLHGFCDYYAGGEAWSFCVDGDQDEGENNWPLTRGNDPLVHDYRAGWWIARLSAQAREGN